MSDFDFCNSKYESLITDLIPVVQCDRVVSIHQTLLTKLKTSLKSYYKTNILSEGAYNIVYNTLQNDVVLRETIVDGDQSIQTFLIENVVHMYLCEYFPNYVPTYHETYQIKYKGFEVYGSVIEKIDPCKEFGKWIKKAPSKEVFKMLIYIAYILNKMQEKLGFQHRDFKPDNILITSSKRRMEPIQIGDTQKIINWDSNTTFQPVIIDFGFARLKTPLELCNNMVSGEDTPKKLNKSQDLGFMVYNIIVGKYCEKNGCPLLYKYFKTLKEYMKKSSQYSSLFDIDDEDDSVIDFDVYKVFEKSHNSKFEPIGFMNDIIKYCEKNKINIWE